MGLKIERESFQDDDFRRFEQRLDSCIDLLRQLSRRPDFGDGGRSIGAELEVSLIDRQGRPAGVNLALIDAMNDPRFTPEIDRFNIEFNSDPLALRGNALDLLGQQLEDALSSLRRHAQAGGVRPLMVGILPSLRQEDLGLEAMTPVPRYRVLNQILRAHRGRPFVLNINGDDPLKLSADDVTYEGANTSFQLHLKLDPQEFVDVFNASQLALGPVLAVAGNSPLFLQHRLWEETRIVVFKQTVDDRSARSQRSHQVSRVGLGAQWWQGDVIDCLARHLRNYDVIMPLCSEEDLQGLPADGSAPDLAELRTHNGTIWHWNRPVYDAIGGGHLRIEFRALPSGPTIIDMQANAAWMLGLSMGLAKQGIDYAQMPFSKVDFNLYRGAQSGLNARLLWPGDKGLRQVRAADLIPELLPVALAGLLELGIDEQRAATYLDVIRARASSGQTGAQWQHDFLTRRAVNMDRSTAMADMVNCYERHSAGGKPVHTWSCGC